MNVYIYIYIRSYQIVERAPRRAVLVLWGGVVCMRDIFILNEIWAKGKIYTLVGPLLG
jgi:hypothetical protein